MNKYKAKLLEFVTNLLQPSNPEHTISILYWGTDDFGPRIAEISATKADKMSGWSYTQVDQDALQILAACERLLLHYELVETMPDDGYALDVELYEDMLRRLFGVEDK